MKQKTSKRVFASIVLLTLATLLTATSVFANETSVSKVVEAEHAMTEQTNSTTTSEVSSTIDETVSKKELVVSTSDATDERTEVIAKTQTDDLIKDLIMKDVDLNSLDINDIEIYTHPIPVGTSSSSIVGYIKLEKDEESTTGLIELTGDMLDGFDSNVAGKKDCILPIGVFKRIVVLDVRENVDINTVGKIIDTTVEVGFDSATLTNVILQNQNDIEYGFINMLDDLGNSICRVKFQAQEITPSLDTSTIGEQSYMINYKSSSLSFKVNVRPVTFKIVNLDDRENPIISLPIDGKLENALVYSTAYDAENGSGYSMGMGLPFKELNTPIDTSKAGFQEIEIIGTGWSGETMTGTVQLNIGISKESTLEELLPPKAQETIPSKNVVGVWDVPSGEAGAGTWTFQTDLAEGKNVTVWSFHNEEWIKIGVYQVDANGVVTVTFQADQLSPVLLTLNSSTSETSSNTSSTENNSSEQPTDSSANTSLEITSPQTGDNTNIILFGLFILLSSASLGILIFVKRKKSNPN